MTLDRIITSVVSILLALALAECAFLAHEVKRAHQLRDEAQADYKLCQANFEDLTSKLAAQNASIQSMADRTEQALKTTSSELAKAQASYRGYKIIVPDTGDLCSRYETVNNQVTEQLQ